MRRSWRAGKKGPDGLVGRGLRLASPAMALRRDGGFARGWGGVAAAGVTRAVVRTAPRRAPTLEAQYCPTRTCSRVRGYAMVAPASKLFEKLEKCSSTRFEAEPFASYDYLVTSRKFFKCPSHIDWTRSYWLAYTLRPGLDAGFNPRVAANRARVWYSSMLLLGPAQCLQGTRHPLSCTTAGYSHKTICFGRPRCRER